MKFASVAIIAAVVVSASASPVLRKKHGDTTVSGSASPILRKKLGKTTNPHEITCAQKFTSEATPYTASKVCCDFSMNCKGMHKCTKSFCEVVEAPEKECRMHCDYGFATKNGKKICKCADKPEHENEFEITCAEKRERNPKALTGRIHKDKPCCQWSNECGSLHKCTQSYCEKDAKPSEVFGDRFDFQF